MQQRMVHWDEHGYVIHWNKHKWRPRFPSGVSIGMKVYLAPKETHYCHVYPPNKPFEVWWAEK